MLLRLFLVILIFIIVIPAHKAQSKGTRSLIVEKEWKIDKGYWGGDIIILAKEIDSSEVLKEDSVFIKSWTFFNKLTPTILFKNNNKIKYYEFHDCLVGEVLHFFSKFEIKENYLYVQHKELNWDKLADFRKGAPSKENLLGYKYEYNISYDTLKYRIDFISNELAFLSLWGYKGKRESPYNYKTAFYRLKEGFKTKIKRD